MIVFVYDWLPNIEGNIDQRPIAVFRNIKDTRRFLRILATNGIYASLKCLEFSCDSERNNNLQEW